MTNLAAHRAQAGKVIHDGLIRAATTTRLNRSSDFNNPPATIRANRGADMKKVLARSGGVEPPRVLPHSDLNADHLAL